MIQAVVFDMDGVIVDSEPLHYRAFLKIAQPYGVDFDYARYLQRYVGFDDREGFAAMLADAQAATNGDQPDTTLIAQMCHAKAHAFESVVAEGLEPLPNVLNLIEHLREQLPLAIATGASRDDAHLILSRLRTIDWFDPIITADDVARSKPDPATYALAVDGLANRNSEAGITPSTCLAIEDTPAGVQSARAAGLHTLAITTTTTADQLRHADRVVDTFEGLTLDQLRAWFDS